ncbi:MAG: rRNA maturation RNase YbeY [Bacteroidales bacterium]|nr:rRNA maturation RNase YbeY [Bacteroidales bacterium]
MAIQFSFQTNYPLKSRTKIKQWIKQVIEAKGKKTGNITYIFCDDEYLLEVNKQYLQHDYYTDVITFDYVENDLISGDIFISTDRVRENALAFGSSEKEELHRVIIHGALHLLGLKDKSEKEASQMRQAENEALELLNE